jgi:cyclase
VFLQAGVDGALAASVFHSAELPIPELKRYLIESKIVIRPPDTQGSKAHG